jgi:pyridoxine kinase
VGNKAAVFPLQLLGFDVDFVNSVHFSNHTGYENGLKGDVLQGDQLRQILKGLEDNHLLDNVGYILTGYIGSISFLEAVLDVLRTVRKVSCAKEHGVRYVCDPVLGDDGRFYVPPELVQVYKTTLIPMADVVTPNQFEVEQLTGIVVTSLAEARHACKALHAMGPSIVFITSCIFAEDKEKSTLETEEGSVSSSGSTGSTIAIIGSRRRLKEEEQQQSEGVDEDGDELWRIDCPLLPGSFTGTGDMTAALLLGHLAQNDFNNLPNAMEKVINTMYCALQRTVALSGDSMQSKELKLIQSKGDIENPPLTFTAKRMTL